MERNLKLILRYDGSTFHGWQMQDNAITVQECVSEAIERILSKKVTIYGCSRTDSGVHANTFCCNFKTHTDKDCEAIRKGIDAVLPQSIAVLGCEDVPLDFNARFSCKGKEYIYKIWNSNVKNPFLTNYALHYPYYLDAEMLDKEVKSFIGTHDFSAFCAAGATTLSNVRTVTDCSVKREGDLITFSVTGDGFLYNMVRIMVGTAIYIGRGKIPKGSIPDIIKSKDRTKAGITAKPHGLYLNKVYYDDDFYGKGDENEKETAET
ncbi:MAG: tRNA pseudouridine(38-40) synthase TruA [Clostridia bacterium]|nr:tRNA pseudouridine(38-40) synthase TruA [Clostridia bacterium]